MIKSKYFPIIIPLAALAFATGHLSFEHFTGGVKSHHLLYNPDLPAISNWYELFTLPLLGFILGMRIRRLPFTSRWAGIPLSILTPLLCSLIYGAVLAISFMLGLENLTSGVLLLLCVFAIVYPIYRIEYIFGFVVGMTITIGGVLPLFFALILAMISFVIRFIIKNIAGLIRKDITDKN